LNTSRDGVVEKFRTSRVTGLSEGNMNPDTATFTPTETSTSTATSTSTETPTTTATPTATATLIPCVTGGNGIRAEYYTYDSSAPPANPFTSPITVGIVDNVNFNWGSGSPAGLPANKFAARYVGQVMPLFTETYTFYASSDDGSRLWVNGVRLVNQWSNQSATERSGTITLNRCQKYDIVLEYFENSGSASLTMSWSSPSQAKQIIPRDVLFSSLGTVSTATITFTPTITRTGTITLTPTRTSTSTQTYTVTRTPTITNTVPSPTRTPTRTATRTRTVTQTVPSPTRTNTEPATPTMTSTGTKTSTSTVTLTPIPPTITNTSNIPTYTPSRTPTRSGGG
jgi:mannan endo-1,4-beta-mannosidase